MSKGRAVLEHGELRPNPHVTAPEEIENGGFSLKTHNMFSVHTTPEEFKNATTTGYFGFVFEETLVKKISHGYRDSVVFRNAPFSKCFSKMKRNGVTCMK